MSDTPKPWNSPMPNPHDLMRRILSAPSPVGLKAAMAYGVLKPHFESFAPAGWQLQQFMGHAVTHTDALPDPHR